MQKVIEMKAKSKFFLILLMLSVVLFTGISSLYAQEGVLPLPAGDSRIFSSVTQLSAAPAEAASQFGASVAVDGDVIAIGAPYYMNGGAVFIFERNASGVWTQTVMGAAPDTTTDDEFGFSVALEGHTVLIGARKHGPDDKGAVYVIEKDEALGMWGFTGFLQPALSNFNYFGRQIALDGDRAVIAASGTGSAYVYKRDNAGLWQYEAKLPTTLFDSYAVAIDGARVAVSTLTEDMYSGAVYIYEPVGGVWTETGHLAPSDGVDFDYFGTALALDGNRLMVGTKMANSSGAVYSFELNAGTWMQEQKLVASDAAANDLFGAALALQNDVLMIGAPGDDSSAGSVYRFGWNGSTWVQQNKIAAVGGQFGFSLDLHHEKLVIGAPEASGEGRVHLYADPALTPVELLTDGGFESSAAGWDIKNPTADKVKCNKPEKSKIFAHTGECAWRFKGGAGENASIKQTILTGVNPGDTLTLSGYVNAKGAVSSKVKVVVKYADGVTPKSKITVNVSVETGGVYAPLSSFQPELTADVTAAIDKVKVSVKNKSTSGKIYYDTLSLTVQ